MHALGLRIVAGTALAIMLAAPHCAFAQGPKKLAATFEERYPAEQSSTQAAPGQPESRGEQQNVPASRRAATPKRPRARVVVMPRNISSFLMISAPAPVMASAAAVTEASTAIVSGARPAPRSRWRGRVAEMSLEIAMTKPSEAVGVMQLYKF